MKFKLLNDSDYFSFKPIIEYNKKCYADSSIDRGLIEINQALLYLLYSYTYSPTRVYLHTDHCTLIDHSSFIYLRARGLHADVYEIVCPLSNV